MKKLIAVFIALMLSGFVSMASATDDFTSGVIANNHALGWGDNTTRIKGNSTDQVVDTIINNTTIQEVGSSGVTITGTATATTFSGSGASLTSIPAAGLASSAVTTPKIASEAVTTAKLYLDLPAMYLPCVTTAHKLGYCSNLTAASGVCNSCN